MLGQLYENQATIAREQVKKLLPKIYRLFMKENK